ncbi:helix-turn-helix domain-containing protein [Yinghuangia sp. YIM S09857]|uniref:helix-turn-helix domain-containing protein n=1 Tax=Yinghuangia sp. YIM S09857 TaxID=3436929 RepID=UPI003F53B8D3
MAIELPEWAWQKPEARLALQARDVGAVFRLAQQYGGHSQQRIASAVDMTQSRVNEIINSRRTVKELDVFERIADGLTMPDDARHILGLASNSRVRAGGSAFDLAAFPEVVRVYSAQAAAASEIQRQARQAAEVDVLAVRGLGLIGLNDSLLRNCLTREDKPRARVRVMLLDPDCDAVAVRAEEIGESPDSLAAGIRLAEFRLQELSDVCDIEVYRYQLIPTWRIVRVDETTYVSAFDAGWEGHESATYKVMETPYGPLYRGFRRMFNALVGDAVRTV